MLIPVELIAPIPKTGDDGAFAKVRKYDIHTGLDLYAADGSPVYAIRSGRVVSIEDFTGSKADSPWWENTQAVLIESRDGVILYGEIVVLGSIKIGMNIFTGQQIGNVKRVLKRDKGRTPTSMLHLELYKHGTTKSVVWLLDKPKPDNLLDPNMLFQNYENI